MAVKIGKLWKNAKFKALPELTKLLYIYLASSTSLNTVGVLTPNIDIICIELSTDIKSLRESTRQLSDKGFIYVKKIDGDVYFIVPEHFSTIPKSEASVLRVQRDLSKLPKKLVTFLEGIGITVSSKVKKFSKPAPEEVTEYAASMGYIVDGNTFVDFYEEKSKSFGRKDVWVDGRGKEVRDWKAKLRKVWFKDENKLKKFKEAPKGFETFYVNNEGKIAYPDGWRNGKPYSKDFLLNRELQKEYERRKKGS